MWKGTVLAHNIVMYSKFLRGTDCTLGPSTCASPTSLPVIKEFSKVMSAARRAISVTNTRECDLSSHHSTMLPARHLRGVEYLSIATIGCKANLTF